MSSIALRPRRLRLVLLVAPVFALGLVFLGQGLFIHAKAFLAQVLLERAFAGSLSAGVPVKPWPWADTWPVARLEFPGLARSVVVLKGSSGQALAFGPGHVEATPEAGDPGTTVYAAHRDTHFNFLGQVMVGDIVRVTRRDGATIPFRVTGTAIVRYDETGIDPEAPGRHLVLSTCWPLDGTAQGPLRYLVFAEAVEEGA